jgi:hypothetical protein
MTRRTSMQITNQKLIKGLEHAGNIGIPEKLKKKDPHRFG